MCTKRSYLIFMLIGQLAQSAVAQQWAIKGLPIVLPFRRETTLVLPFAVEYTFTDRFGVQVAPGFAFYHQRLTPKNIPESHTLRHYHLNIGSRRYLGKKTLNRAWFVGVNVWRSYELRQFNDPRILTTPSGILLQLSVSTTYQSLGGVIGKNFVLRGPWFLETKVSVERVAVNESFNQLLNDMPSRREYYYNGFWPKPTVMIGYRW
jgi:hypothetical protein